MSILDTHKHTKIHLYSKEQMQKDILKLHSRLLNFHLTCTELFLEWMESYAIIAVSPEI